MDKIKEYRTRAEKFANEYRVKPEDMGHVTDMVSSVMMTRDKYIRGGGFVQAVVDNDLYQAINRGDETCLRNLKVIVASREYCHLR